MRQRNETSLWLGPKPETKNIELKVKDMVYFWESAAKTPKEPGRLVARGEVIQAATRTPVDMPAWQQLFCVDKATGQSGPKFHKIGPRAKIRIDFFSIQTVTRDLTGVIPILNENSFLKKRGFYSKTIFDLTESQANELDKLAGWQPLILPNPPTTST